MLPPGGQADQRHDLQRRARSARDRRCPRRGCGWRPTASTASAVKPSTGGSSDTQLARTSSVAWPAGTSWPPSPTTGWRAGQQAGGEISGGQQHHRGDREGHRGQELAGEQLAAGARPGQDGLPGAEVVLGGEDVTGHDGGEHRQQPLPAETENDHRDGEAGDVHPLAERRVAGGRALQVQARDREERDDHGTRQRSPGPAAGWPSLASSSRHTASTPERFPAPAAGPANAGHWPSARFTAPPGRQAHARGAAVPR